MKRVEILLAVAVAAGATALAMPWVSASNQPVAPAGGQAAQDAGAGSLKTEDIGMEAAQAAIAAAVSKAKELNTKMDIAIVDAGANLKAFTRMDGAWLGSIDISIRKARTARFFNMPTGDIGSLSQPGGPLFTLDHSNGGLITFPCAGGITHGAG